MKLYLIMALTYIFLMVNDNEHCFHIPFNHLYVFFGEMSIKSLVALRRALCATYWG